MKTLIRAAIAMGLTSALCLSDAAQAEPQAYLQQGPKIVVPNSLFAAANAVALSSDGSTALVGATLEPVGGAVWVYVRVSGGWTQQAKLTPATPVELAQFGRSVALSADGNTAFVGAPGDGIDGAAWVFTRNGGAWSQQGGKLTGTGGVTGAGQGVSVALSADGNTAIVGGNSDSSLTGAAWVFTRNGGIWSQQGAKLVGTGASGPARQGGSVGLSADGNTAIVGGSSDNSTAGAAWVFTRSGSLWSQQGAKLFGTGNVGAARQGASVALAADGATAIVGGTDDNSFAGAAWVYTRSGGVWSQQGGKLAGTGAVGSAKQGDSVALSADGNIAIVGASGDAGATGAAWFYTRSAGVWRQRGAKITPVGGVGPQFGRSAAISGAGDVAFIGGAGDVGGVGAAWAFVRRVQRDFNLDARADVIWRDTSGAIAISVLNNPFVLAQLIGYVPSNWSIVGIRDFDGDGKADILWRDDGGNVALWFMDGVQVLGGASVGNIPVSWSVAGVGDFNGDGRADILWRNSDGAIAMWLMNGAQVVTNASLGAVTTQWTIAGLGDLDGDGMSDLVWRGPNGEVAGWFMNGASVTSGPLIGQAPTNWTILGTGDFNNDGRADILWRGPAGEVSTWLMNAATVVSGPLIGQAPLTWQTFGVGDFNNDGRADIIWRDTTGLVAAWFLDGAIPPRGPLIGVMPTAWTIQNPKGD